MFYNNYNSSNNNTSRSSTNNNNNSDEPEPDPESSIMLMSISSRCNKIQFDTTTDDDRNYNSGHKMRRKAPSPDSEPTSVLDHLPTFSSPTVTSSTAAAAASLPPFPSPAPLAGAGAGGDDPSFLRWLMADADDLGFELDPAVVPLPAPSEHVLAAAELIDSGDLVGARGILARLNHHHPYPSPSSSSSSSAAAVRAALHFSGALLRLLLLAPAPAAAAPPPNPILNLGACKAFADASPVPHFADLAAVQALLDRLDGAADPLHVVDFDVGVGARWPALVRELSRRPPPLPALRITAVVAAHHLFDLRLVRDNLAQFAAECAVPFEFDAVALDAFDPQDLRSVSGQFDASVFVNLPIGHTANLPIQSLLPLIKQLNPKLVFSVNHLCGSGGGSGGSSGAGGGEFSFARHVFNSLQSATALLESIDAAGMSPDLADMIERFILLPRIENAVLRFHHRSPAEKTMTWRILFASAGFVPFQLSDLAEAQAECLLRRHPIRGFHVEQREAALVLCWQNGRELVSVSAWR